MTGTIVVPRKQTSLAYSSAHAVVTNVVQVVGVILTSAIIARMLGPAGKGAYDMYAAGAALLTAVLTLSLNQGLIFVIASKAVNLVGLGGRVLLFTVLCGLFALAIVAALSRLRVGQAWLPGMLGAATPLLMALGVFALAVSAMSRAFLTGQRRFLYANYGDVSKQVIGIVLLFVAFLAAHRLHLAVLPLVVLSNIAAVLFTALIYGYLVDFRQGVQTVSHGFGTCFAFAMPCYGATVIQFLNYRLDVFFVSSWHGTTAVGVYQAGVLIAQAINTIPSTVQGILFPTISAVHAAGGSKAAQVAQANRLLTSASLLFGAVLFVSAPFAIPRIYGAAFAGSATALQILTPGCILFVTANVVASFFSGIGKPQLNLIASGVGIVITILFDLLLIPKWGYLGAASASTISYASSAVTIALLFKRETRISLMSLYIPAYEDLRVIRGIFAEFTHGVRSRIGI